MTLAIPQTVTVFERVRVHHVVKDIQKADIDSKEQYTGRACLWTREITEIVKEVTVDD